ncbi:hypothetical protein SNE40_011583 [Patella caerulea]|uniref:Glutathione peroxidase n=1 Tax=Patella caerulea TaxID=87958 RepID=A0AAN8JNS6_PATCE
MTSFSMPLTSDSLSKKLQGCMRVHCPNKYYCLFLQVTLVVNVASECGYTDGHYRSLVRLQNKLGQHNKFSVLAFPCNQFGEQEPGTRKDIQAFTKKYYHINFPLFDKINVLPPNVAEPWQFLIKSAKVAPNWNFWKYLVDENGHVLNAWGPAESVEDIFYEVRDAVNKISTHAYDEL